MDSADDERVPHAVEQIGSASDGSILFQAAGDITVMTAPATTVVPRQLPASPGLFTGRVAELDGLDRALAASVLTDAAPEERNKVARIPDSADSPVAEATVMVSAIGGAGGIGKTWLVLAWAHRHLDRFADGQLFVDLHGFSPAGEPVTSGAAVRGFLDALGVEPGRIPSDLDGQAALYRSLVAGRRMLVVLDNAATTDQVVPLLPGSPTCTVLVTSRRKLAALIDRHGARHLALDVLASSEARSLLTARLGMDRVAAEPDVVDELVDLCGGYPLALSITARNAATRTAIPLTEIAAELRELGLEMLDHDTDSSASLPAVLSWSLLHLTEEQRTVFGLLGIAPGPDTTLPAVASLADLPSTRARKTLLALEEASLIERRPGSRYAMHDLIRDYATATAQATLSDDAREMALARVMDFHLHTAHSADRLLYPSRQLLHLDLPASGVQPHPLLNVAAATAWLEVEHSSLLATQRTAAAFGRHLVVWHLAWTLETFHQRRGYRRDALNSWRAALKAAANLPDPTKRSRAHRLLGRACAQLGLHKEATEHLDQALDLATHHRDPSEKAHTHQILAAAWERQGDNQQARDHARHALDIYRTLDRPAWEAEALNQVGWLTARLGDFDNAHDHCSDALILHRNHQNPAGEALALDNLGSIAHFKYNHQQAIDYYCQALILYRALGHTYGVAGIFDSLGHPYAALGLHDQARAAWREALKLYRELGRDTDAERVQRQVDNANNSTYTNLSNS